MPLARISTGECNKWLRAKRQKYGIPIRLVRRSLDFTKRDSVHDWDKIVQDEIRTSV